MYMKIHFFGDRKQAFFLEVLNQWGGGGPRLGLSPARKICWRLTIAVLTHSYVAVLLIRNASVTFALQSLLLLGLELTSE